MDLHGNVSRELVHGSDLITCYRMAPHEDHMETKERAARNLVELLAPARPGRSRPGCRCRCCWPGRRPPPGSSRPGACTRPSREVEALDGVIDAAIWVGYAWADEPRNRAAVVVTGDDEEAVIGRAERLAQALLGGPRRLRLRRPDRHASTECLDDGPGDPTGGPYFISDTGDNPTAGRRRRRDLGA